MTEIELSITRLAALGRSPYQIEEALGIPHYTIHQKYHAALMSGYEARERLEDSKSKEFTTAPAEPIERQETKTKEELRKREKLAESQHRYYQNHKAEIKERQSRYRAANREKIAEHIRRYRLANKEKIAERQRRYQQANREKIAEYKREYDRANKEKFAEYQRKYRQANREKVAEIRRKYYQANKEKFAEWQRQYAHKRKEKQVDQQTGETAWQDNQTPTGALNGAGLK